MSTATGFALARANLAGARIFSDGRSWAWSYGAGHRTKFKTDVEAAENFLSRMRPNWPAAYVIERKELEGPMWYVTVAVWGNGTGHIPRVLVSRLPSREATKPHVMTWAKKLNLPHYNESTGVLTDLGNHDGSTFAADASLVPAE